MGNRMRCGYYQRLVVVIGLVLSMLSPSSAFAAAVPAYSGKMNNAIGGIVQQKVGKWGFAANDPRIPATINGIGAGVTTLVVGGLGVAVGAATWPAVLVGAGITALVSGLVSLGQDAATRWYFNSDGTITMPGTGTSPPAYTTGFYSYVTQQNYATLAQACASIAGSKRNSGGCSP